jgi:hypothetical protein
MKQEALEAWERAAQLAPDDEKLAANINELRGHILTN